MPVSIVSLKRPDFSLLRWFSVTSLLSVIVFSVGVALVMTRFLEQHMLDRDAAVSREFVQSIVNTQRVAEYFERGEAGAASAFAEFFSHIAAMPDVLRANVYAPDRRALWSSDAAIIGRVFERNDELEEALTGEVVVNRGSIADELKDKPEHMLLGAERVDYVENYLPVYDSAGQRLIGVVELYKVPRALFRTIQEGTRMVWASAIVGGLFLYLSLLWLVVRANRVLREQRSRLVETEALALVGEMSAAVAHSIRNPLASIRSSAELQIEIGEARREVAQEVVRNVDRIDRLVRTILSYASDAPDGGAAATTDLRKAVMEVVEHFEAQFQARGTHLTVGLADDLPAVRADAVLVMQVLNSILANALEATGVGDIVRIEARAAPRAATLEVIDSGMGVAPSDIDKVFKPFYTTKARGLGMGLALVRRTVSRLGGSVQMTSEPGRGTRVTVMLPAAKSNESNRTKDVALGAVTQPDGHSASSAPTAR
jgi:signal transduction histidine kinase